MDLMLSIKVDIPSLTALLAYLRERDQTQATIDAITKRVRQATSNLRTSNTALNAAVNQNQTREGE